MECVNCTHPPETHRKADEDPNHPEAHCEAFGWVAGKVNGWGCTCGGFIAEED